MTLHAGIDFGTSGCRLVVIDTEGAVRGYSAAQLPPPTRIGSRAEQHPELWWEALDQALIDLHRHVPAEQIRSIAVDGTSATLLLTDAHGQPLGPALMYDDSRSRVQAERIAVLAPRRSAAHGATSSLAKLLFLHQAIPGAVRALHQADWIAGRLCGNFGISDENNALKLGYDAAARAWPSWLEQLNVPDTLLPRVLPPGTPIGTITSHWAARWKLSANTLLVAGTTDSVAGFLATGARNPGEAVTSLGSTLVLKVLCDQPIFAPHYGVYSHRLENRWLAGGASNTGGGTLLKFFSIERLRELSGQLDPERPTGLQYYPLPQPGERFPINDPCRAPIVHPRPKDDAVFLQGLLEGIAHVEAEGYRLLAKLGAPYPLSVKSVGGGAMNRAFTRIRASALGVPVTSPRHSEAAYGSAQLARSGYRQARQETQQR
ncbi:MAG: FGGY-family carbohydrate kinase [Gammaproteobacteria bacterium]